MQTRTCETLGNEKRPASLAADFWLLGRGQARSSWNSLRHQPAGTKLATAAIAVFMLVLLFYLGRLAVGVLGVLPAAVAEGLFSLLFLAAVATQLFTGVTTAFQTLYLSPDLPILFAAPVSIRAVFAVKSLVIGLANLLPLVAFAVLPAVFYGLGITATPGYYLTAIVVSLGLWLLGTALAELVNLAAMRLIPPHRAREAMGAIGAVAGLVIALVFQLPNWLGDGQTLPQMLGGQEEALGALRWLPTGWGAMALIKAAAGDPAGLDWSLGTVALALGVFLGTSLLVERGFRQGWVGVNQAPARRVRPRQTPAVAPASRHPAELLAARGNLPPAPPRAAVWAVARKDLLALRRDTREWIGLISPLVIMFFFLFQAASQPDDPGIRASLTTIILVFAVMLSSQLAAGAFGREGEAPWILNAAPVAGWSVVWGKLAAAALPTLLLMEAVFLPAALVFKFPPALLAGLAVRLVFLTLGSSAIGLYFSSRYAAYNPETPQRISGSGMWLLLLVNLVFIALLAYAAAVAFLPAGYLPLVEILAPPAPAGGLFPTLLYWLTRPFLWPRPYAITFGVLLFLGMWATVGGGFLTATARQVEHGVQVQIVHGKGRRRR